jgi:hypothetical protein
MVVQYLALLEKTTWGSDQQIRSVPSIAPKTLSSLMAIAAIETLLSRFGGIHIGASRVWRPGVTSTV